MAKNLVTMKFAKSKIGTNPIILQNTVSSETVPESQSIASTLTLKERSMRTFDKDVTASSSNIDFFNTKIPDTDTSAAKSIESVSKNPENIVKADTVQTSKDRPNWRRDKYPREHRVKVRSPKRRAAVFETKNDVISTRTIGTVVIDWDQELGCIESNVIETVESTENDDRPSDHSIDDMCRICHGGDALSAELGLLISACSCRGTVGRVHVKCLERWLTESGKSRCELCGTRYSTRRVHKYGMPRALIMWILSQNSKQLMVDSLGIMLMSPLAVLAAWLSGRTLANLMMQDNHATPWPLASTFVLACMTLVCYYCWIVSAVTRHTIGWWIWYRSQYEVRLEIHENES